MKRIVCVFLLAALLTGCGWNGETYVQVTPRNDRTAGNSTGAAPAENEEQLRAALQRMAASGIENDILYTLNMDSEELDQFMARTVHFIRMEDAIGAYAVDSVRYEIGTNSGKTAVACSITYRHNAVEIRKILHLRNVEQMRKAITEALEDCRTGVVMRVDNYEETDIAQLVQDIARTSPQTVMEIPEVVEEVYGSGEAKVVELSFSYENSRESLRQMQSQVAPVFDSAALYVSGDGSDFQKFSQLYAFLMERFDYNIGTSITPAYSLLRHGVGDSRAFATVYAAMCAKAGLECLVVTGTRLGDPWTWNMICDSGRYYHVDLLASAPNNFFREIIDADMVGYVWDYSAYPECPGYGPIESTIEAAEP